MKRLYNKDRYISQHLVDQCFDLGSHNYVDKVLCGNGFSTSFLTKVPPKGKINIMIAPNKSVLQSKEEAYISGTLKTDNIIKFIYADSTDKSWEDATILMFVIDSFIINKTNIKSYHNLVDRVLIDEYHSLYQQSLFRPRLVDFDKIVDDIFLESSAVVSVTATPNIYTQDTTHIIDNTQKHDIDIYYTMDKEASIERLKESFDSGDKIVIATHDTKIIVELAEREELRANYIIGNSFYNSLAKKIDIIQDVESNIIVLSARGFEGGDIYGEGYKVWFFEDRAHEHETFYISNLYQAINRVRDGADYVEYCRNTLSKRRKVISEKKLDKHIKRDDISSENKLTKEFSEFKDFRIVEKGKKNKISVKANPIAYGLARERRLYDLGFGGFQEFLDERGISIIELDNDNNRSKQQRFSRDHKIQKLYNNRKGLKERDSFSDKHKLLVNKFDKFEQYQRDIDEWFIEKNYDSEFVLTDRMLKTLELMMDQDKVMELAKEMSRVYSEKSISKYGYKASQYYRNKFNENSLEYVMSMIQSLTNAEITVPREEVAHRHYNVLTKMSVNNIKMMSDIYNVDMREIDIKSAFPRTVYAEAGLPLPSDIYGVNKEKKVEVNTVLNMVWYNKKSSVPKRQQKHKAKERLKRAGIHEKAIDYMLENFFESKHKGDFFNHMAMCESEIIGKLKKQIKETNPNIEGIIRRHDSLIVFGEVEDLSFLPEFEYLNQIGWFA